MKVLVTVASKHGGTDTIAERIVETLRDDGLDVELRSPKEVFDLQPYDAVVVGSAVYIGRWLEPARAFVTRHADELRDRHVWLFSSGPLGDVSGPIETATDVPQMVELSGAREHRSFAGKLIRDEIGLAERAIVSVVKAPYGDFRDWPAIATWARSIAEQLVAVATG
jgi:menaquinone-dependent protoporphyrinogen oxidase